MKLGWEINSRIIQVGDIKPFIAAGMTEGWLADPEEMSTAVFADTDREVYQLLLEHWGEHKVVLTAKELRRNFPNYRLSDEHYIPDVLIKYARTQVTMAIASDLIENLVDAHDAHNALEIRAAMTAAVDKVRKGIRGTDRSVKTTGASFDLNERWERKPVQGIPLGIPLIDKEYRGFQKNWLVTLLGRQKATKSTLMMNSALAAWRAEKKVLFYSVELDDEFVWERIHSLGAKVGPENWDDSTLWTREQKVKLEEFNASLNDKLIVARVGFGTTIETLREDVEAYEPDVVYVDGFYFLEDRKTHKSAGVDWQANEQVSMELKALGMEQDITVVTSTQSQEKQQGSKKKGAGIEARTIMGGTGLLKYSDVVLGADKDEDSNDIILTDVLDRRKPIPSVRLTWNWDDMTLDAAHYTEHSVDTPERREKRLAYFDRLQQQAEAEEAPRQGKRTVHHRG